MITKQLLGGSYVERRVQRISQSSRYSWGSRLIPHRLTEYTSRNKHSFISRTCPRRTVCIHSLRNTIQNVVPFQSQASNTRKRRQNQRESNLQSNQVRQPVTRSSRRGILTQRTIQMGRKHGHIDQVFGGIERENEQIQWCRRSRCHDRHTLDIIIRG